jgi:hypothetical protein
MRTTAAIATVLPRGDVRAGERIARDGRDQHATTFHHLHLNSVDPAAANVLQGGAINARKLEEVPLSV